jgi:hypothetical protein
MVWPVSEDRRDPAQGQEWWKDPAHEEEWLRQLNVIYGGLIVLGVYRVQPFLTAASLDRSAKVCVVAFSLAIPLLAALVLVNLQPPSATRATAIARSQAAPLSRLPFR